MIFNIIVYPYLRTSYVHASLYLNGQKTRHLCKHSNIRNHQKVRNTKTSIITYAIIKRLHQKVSKIMHSKETLPPKHQRKSFWYTLRATLTTHNPAVNGDTQTS